MCDWPHPRAFRRGRLCGTTARRKRGSINAFPASRRSATTVSLGTGVPSVWRRSSRKLRVVSKLSNEIQRHGSAECAGATCEYLRREQRHLEVCIARTDRFNERARLLPGRVVFARGG